MVLRKFEFVEMGNFECSKAGFLLMIEEVEERSWMAFLYSN